MNFFAHAVLALERSADERFVLGAMLPDLVAMAGLRLTQVVDPALARGVRFHRDGDEAFHAAPLFQELLREARQDLRQAGVGRGVVLAAPHVAVELLLDGWLAQDAGAVAGFREVFRGAGAAPPGVAPAPGSRNVCPTQAWSELRTRLLSSGLPQAYGDADFVADRVVHVLSLRPACTTRPHEIPSILRSTRALRRRTWDEADGLVAAVREALGQARSESTP